MKTMKAINRKLLIFILFISATLLTFCGFFSMNWKKVSAEAANDDIKLNAASVRYAEDNVGPGIRFQILISDTWYNENKENADFEVGARLVPTKLLDSSKEITADADLDSDVAVAVASKFENYGSGYKQAIVYVYNIPRNDYCTELTIVAYAKNSSDTIWSGVETFTLAQVAKATDTNGLDQAQQSALSSYYTFEVKYYDTKDSTEPSTTVSATAGAMLSKPETDKTCEGWTNAAGTSTWDFENSTVSGDMRLFKSVADTDKHVYADNGACSHCLVSHGTHRTKVSDGSGYIVDNKKSDYKIVYHAESDTVYDWFGSESAKVLQSYIETSTGCKLPIVQDKDLGAYSKDSKYIFIGSVKFLTDAGITYSTEELGTSGFKIRSDGTNIFLGGASTQATDYAVYELLYHLIGYEQFSMNYEYYERLDAIPTKIFDIVEVPDAEYRYKYNGSFTAKNLDTLRLTDESEIFMTNYTDDAGNNQYITWSHNSFTYLPVETYQGKHKKWYYDSDSGRWSTSYTQLCYTAQGDTDEFNSMVDEVFGIMKKLIKENPTKKYVTFFAEDDGTWCDCSECTSLKNTNGSSSASYVRFINALAKKISSDEETKDSGVTLMMLAYRGTLEPPTGLELENNVEVIYAPIDMDWTKSINDEANKTYKEYAEGWSKVAKNMSVWCYQTYFFNYLVPEATWGTYEDLYRYYYGMDVNLTINQGQFDNAATTAFNELKIYLSSKLSWNVYYDEEKLTKNFFEKAYGDAAEKMMAYFDSLRENAAKFNLDGVDTKLEDLGDTEHELIETWLGYLDEAYAALKETKKNNPSYASQLRMVKLESIFPRYIQLVYFSSKYSQNELSALQSSFVEDVKTLNVTNVYQKTKIETLWEDWNSNAVNAGVAAYDRTQYGNLLKMQSGASSGGLFSGTWERQDYNGGFVGFANLTDATLDLKSYYNLNDVEAIYIEYGVILGNAKDVTVSVNGQGSFSLKANDGKLVISKAELTALGVTSDATLRSIKFTGNGNVEYLNVTSVTMLDAEEYRDWQEAHKAEMEAQKPELDELLKMDSNDSLKLFTHTVSNFAASFDQSTGVRVNVQNGNGYATLNLKSLYQLNDIGGIKITYSMLTGYSRNVTLKVNGSATFTMSASTATATLTITKQQLLNAGMTGEDYLSSITFNPTGDYTVIYLSNVDIMTVAEAEAEANAAKAELDNLLKMDSAESDALFTFGVGAGNATGYGKDNKTAVRLNVYNNGEGVTTLNLKSLYQVKDIQSITITYSILTANDLGTRAAIWVNAEESGKHFELTNANTSLTITKQDLLDRGMTEESYLSSIIFDYFASADGYTVIYLSNVDIVTAAEAGTV